LSKVLIVDDNASIVKVMRLLLEREGYQVQSGDDAGVFHLAESWQPTVILMDLRLPNLNGIEACRELKRNPVTSTIPVVLLTADTEAEGLVATSGADDLLMKPFRNNDLLETIRKHALSR
jgi:CheY-like chemotaxis protein